MPNLNILIKAQDNASEVFKKIAAESKTAQQEINGFNMAELNKKLEASEKKVGELQQKFSATMQVIRAEAQDAVEVKFETEGLDGVVAASQSVNRAMDAIPNSVKTKISESGGAKVKSTLSDLREASLELQGKRVLIKIAERGAKAVSAQLLGLNKQALKLEAKRVVMDIAVRGGRLALKYLTDMDGARDRVDGEVAQIKAFVSNYAQTKSRLEGLKEAAEGYGNRAYEAWVGMKNYRQTKREADDLYGHLNKMTSNQGRGWHIALGLGGVAGVMYGINRIRKKGKDLESDKIEPGVGLRGGAATLSQMQAIENRANALDGRDINLDFDAKGAILLPKLLGDSISMISKFQTIAAAMHAIQIPAMIGALGGVGAAALSATTGIASLGIAIGQGLVGAMGAASSALMQMVGGFGLIAAAAMPTITALQNHKTASNQLATAQDAVRSANQGVIAAEAGVAQAARAGAQAVSAAKQGEYDARRQAADGAIAAADAVKDAEDGLASARNDLRDSTEELFFAQREFNDALADEPLNQREATLDLADARDRASDALREYNDAVREHGRRSEEATDAQRALARANLDLEQTERDVRRTRNRTSEEFQSAADRYLQAREDQKGASNGVKDAEKQLARALKDQDRARIDGQRAIAQAQKETAQAQREANEGVKQAQAELTNAVKALTAAQEEAKKASLVSGAVLTASQKRVYESLIRLKKTYKDSFSTASREMDGLMLKVIQFVEGALPRLGAEATRNVGAFSRAIEGAMRALSSPAQLRIFDDFLSRLPKAVFHGTNALSQLGITLFNTLTAGSEHGIRLLRYFDRMTAAAMRFTQSAKGQNILNSVWGSLVERAIQLWHAAKNLGAGLWGVVQALRAAGLVDSMMSGFVGLTARFREFTAAGSEGRAMIEKFAVASKPILNAIWGVLKTLVLEFFRVSNAITMAGTESGKLNPVVAVLNGIQGAIRPIGRLIEKNMIALGPKIGPLITNLAKLAEVFLSSIPPLEFFIDMLNKALGWFTSLDPAVQRVSAGFVSWAIAINMLSGGAIGGLIAKIMRLGKGLTGGLWKGVKHADGGMKKLDGVFRKVFASLLPFVSKLPVVSGAIGLLGVAVGPVALAVIGLGVAAAGLIANWDKVVGFFQGRGITSTKSFGDALRNLGQRIATGLTQKARAARDWFVSNWPKIQQTIVRGAETIWNHAWPLIKQFFSLAKGAVMGAIPVFKQIGQTVLDLARMALPHLVAIWKDFHHGIVAALPILKPLGAFIGGILLGAFKALWPIIKIVATVLGGALLLALRGAAMLFAKLGEAIGWIGRKLSPFSGTINKIGQVIGYVFATVVAGAVGKGIQLVGKLVTWSPKLVAFASKFRFLGNAAQFVWRVVKAVFNVFKVAGGVLTGVITRVAQLVLRWSPLGNVIRVVGKGLKFLFPVLGRLGGAFGKIGGLVRKAGLWFYKLGVRLGSSKNVIAKFVGSALRSLGRFVVRISKAGKAIVFGLVDSVLGFGGAAIRAFIQFFGDIYKRVKKWLGIRSPSRKFRTIGVAMIRGVVSGIKGLGGAVLGGVKNVIGKAWNWLKKHTKSVWSSSLVKMIVAAVKRWAAVVKTNISIIKSVIRVAWNIIKSATTRVWNGIKKYFGGLWKVLKGIFSGNLKQIKAGLKQSFTAQKQITSTIWKAVRSLLKLAWAGIKAIFKNTLSGIRDIVRIAWDWVKSKTKSIWNSIKSFLKNILDNIWKIVKGVYNRLKEATKNAWESIKESTSSRVRRAKEIVQETLKNMKNKAVSIWNSIKKAAKDIWRSISGAIWKPIETAYNKVVGWMQKLLDFVNGILKKLGLDPIGSDGGGGGKKYTGKRGKAPAGGSDRKADKVLGRPTGLAKGGYFENSKYEVGGTGGMGTGNVNPRVHMWNEQQGNEAYIAERGPRNNQLHYLRTAAKWFNHDVVPAPSSENGGDTAMRRAHGLPARHGQHFARGGIAGRAPELYRAALGATTYNWSPELKDRIAKVNKGAGINKGNASWNTYVNHPGGEANSVDWWAPAGRGAPLNVGTGNRIWNYINSNMRNVLRWMIWQGKHTSGIGGAGHFDHLHATLGGGPAVGGSGSSMSGGAGGMPNPKQALFERLWKTVQNRVIDPFLGPMKSSNSIAMNIVGAAAQKVPDGIRDYIDSKIPDTIGGGGSGGMGGSGSYASGKTLREWAENGLRLGNVFEASQANVKKIMGRAQQESSGNPNAVNDWDSNAQAGTPSKGLMQIIESTWNAYTTGEIGNFKKNWSDPVKSVAVASRYMKGRYGHVVGPTGSGYALGGIIPGERGKPVIARVHAGERVLPANLTKAFDGFSRQMSRAYREQRMRAHRNSDRGGRSILDEAMGSDMGRYARRTAQRTKREAQREAREGRSQFNVDMRGMTINQRDGEDVEKMLERAAKKHGDEFERRMRKVMGQGSKFKGRVAGDDRIG